MQDGKAVLPLGTLTVEETKAPNGYLLDGAYMQAGDKSEQIKGLYVTQITEDGDLAVLSGSNQFSVSDKVIRGGVKIQKRDLETGDAKPQGSATLKDTAFDIISLNDNAVLVEGKLYKKNEVVKTIRTDIDGVASTSSDLLPYGNFRIVESEAPDGYLTDGAKPIDFTITENGKIVDLTDEAHSIYNQIKRGDIEGVKIGAGTHKRLADIPFRITSKTTLEFAGESEPVFEKDKNNRRVLTRRSYNLYSDVQKGENVVVEIPVQAGEKKFKYEQKVKLVNPKLYDRGYAIGDIVRNYRKELKRRRNKEISYCELPEIVVEKLAVWDEYESDYTAFDVCGIEVRVLDDDLAEAIKYLSEKDREILLMYFFLGMSDTEIGDRLKINRSTSFRSRKNSLEELKKKLKENMNDE